VLIAAAVVGTGILMARHRTSEPTAAPSDKAALPGPVINPPPAQPRDPKMVTIKIDSRPGGARVVRIADGVNMGTTPWEHPFEAGRETIELRLDRDGYEPLTLQIPLFADRNEDVVLKPKAVPPPPPPPKPGKKHSHHTETDEPAKL
jgi:hypothetical protein